MAGLMTVIHRHIKKHQRKEQIDLLTVRKGRRPLDQANVSQNTYPCQHPRVGMILSHYLNKIHRGAGPAGNSLL